MSKTVQCKNGVNIHIISIIIVIIITVIVMVVVIKAQ